MAKCMSQIQAQQTEKLFKDLFEKCDEKHIDLGYEVFTDMLNSQSSIQKLFNYNSKEETQSHTKNIINALIEVVQNCGNTQTIGKVLEKTNIQHANVHISDEEYWQFEKSLIKQAKLIAGEDYLNQDKYELIHNLLKMYRDAWLKTQSS